MPGTLGQPTDSIARCDRPIDASSLSDQWVEDLNNLDAAIAVLKAMLLNSGTQNSGNQHLIEIPNPIFVSSIKFRGIYLPKTCGKSYVP
ncbi:MAG: hypothetical protein AB1589_38655 [Cyanobacteriota bacterium]